AAAPLKAGMLIGSVYRLRVIGIPRHEGVEVFPTIEVVNRLYPPPGQELRFPVPVELTLEDLELAMEGHFVTRIIYLEYPKLSPGCSVIRENSGPLERASEFSRIQLRALLAAALLCLIGCQAPQPHGPIPTDSDGGPVHASPKFAAGATKSPLLPQQPGLPM